MAGLNNSTNDALGSEKFEEIEDSIDSINAYRLQVNQSLLSIKEKLNELELSISDPKNE